MSDGDNGREFPRGVFPSNGSGKPARELIFETLTHGLEAGSPGAGGPRPAEADGLQAAREAGAQQERDWLARELHDSVSPAFYSIGLLTNTALIDLDANPDKARLALKLVLGLAKRQLDEMRQLMIYIHAASLVEALTETVAFAREYAGVQAEAELCPEPALNDAAKVALYKISREAVHNAVKHAQCYRLLVKLELRDGQVVLDVSDDGLGFDPATVPYGHYGLTSMRERAALVGGTFEIKSAPGAGTSVRVAVPLSEEQEAR